ncbi:MAG: class I SAM-dependent methyltransferase [Acetatifactor sp.]
MEKLSEISREVLNNILNYNEDHYERIDRICNQYSLMPKTERKFVHGMLSFFRPKRVLELGVALGGGSLVILNAINSFESKLISVDIEEKYVNDTRYEVGHIVKNSSSIVNLEQWELYTGVDVSEIITKQNEKFDFVVIDTAHIHPIESLNFLSIMPFLTDDAIVLIQDISLYAMCLHLHGFWHVPLSEGVKVRNASKLLYDTLVGDKYNLPFSAYSEDDKKQWNIEFSNMGVIQINEDTKKYIGNLFSMLEYPWGIYPIGLRNISNIIKQYYSEEHYTSFKFAMNRNLRLLYHKLYAYSLTENEIDFNTYSKIIFYGAGECLKHYLCEKQIMVFPDEIWDIRAKEINLSIPEWLEGYEITEPHFSLCGDCLIVIFADINNNQAAAKEMHNICMEHGLENIMYAEDLYKMFG